MIETNISASDLLAHEARVEDYLPNGKTDLETIIDSAYDVIYSYFINAGKDIKRFCKRLALGTVAPTSEDFAQRNRLVVVCSAYVSSGIVTLKGCNASDGTFTDITTLTIDSAATFTKKFYDLYPFYKYSVTGTNTISVYLVETNFELAHLFLSLSMAYREIVSLTNSNWREKADFYMGLYEKEIEGLLYSYDVDEDEAIEESETGQNNRVTFTR